MERENDIKLYNWSDSFFVLISGFMFNIINLFKKKAIYEKLVFLSLCLFNFLASLVILQMKEYNVPAVFYAPAAPFTEYHTPISSEYIHGITLIMLIYIVSLYLFFKMKNKIPPLIKAARLSGIFCGLILNIVIVIQL